MNANHVSQQSNQQPSRKIQYVDHLLQKRLLFALVALEVALLCIVGAILYIRLNAIVDENLYRIHFADQPSMFSVLLKESLLILGGLVVANLFAMFVADRIWSSYVNGIMKDLRGLFSRTQDLDLQPDRETPYQHKVLELALAWRQAERERNLSLHTHVEQVVSIATMQSLSPDEYRHCLIALRDQLSGSGTAMHLISEADENSALTQRESE